MTEFAPTREDVLAHELAQACHTIEFLHCCLMDPPVDGVPVVFTYAYPGQTIAKLARWRSLTAEAPVCSAPMFSSKHDEPCPIHNAAFGLLRQQMEAGQ